MSNFLFFEYLVKLKYGKNYDLIKLLMDSEIPIFDNNYEKCMQFLGTFFFCNVMGFSATDILKNNTYDCVIKTSIKEKLMSYDECVCTWNEISKCGLKHARMSNNEISATVGIMPFWDILQSTVNSHYRKLYIKDWDINQKMSIVIDDDKHHFNINVGTDNLKSARHVRDNRQGLTCHAAASASNNFTLGTQHEKSNDATFTAAA